MRDTRYNLKEEGVQLFTGFDSAVENFSSLWQKPADCGMLFALCISAGKPGGNGFVGAAGAAGGGGGGSGGNYSVLLVPSFTIPDELYIAVPPGSPMVFSSFENLTGVSIMPGSQSAASANGRNTALINTGKSGSAASNGNAAAGGATQAPGAVSTAGTCCLSGLGLTKFYQGGVGVAGGFGAAGNNNTTGTSITRGGAGGAGLGSTTGFNGGTTVGSQENRPTLPGGIGSSGVTVNGSDGSTGSMLRQLFLSQGGSGGGRGHGVGTAGLSNGGNGGKGGFPGGGGGGGGGAVTGCTAGVGGQGGDGLVVMVSI